MTKEDYMRLPKERLAELLEERDIDNFYNSPIQQPLEQHKNGPCFGGNICTNPFHDCINCPRLGASGGYIVTTTSTNSIF